MKKLKSITVKTGSADEFMARVKGAMRALDHQAPIKPAHTLMFEDAGDLLHFLSKAKLQLIQRISEHPGSITALAKGIKRSKAAVCRDIKELEKFGLVKTHNVINPGHGQHKIVSVAAARLKLEAYVL